MTPPTAARPDADTSHVAARLRLSATRLARRLRQEADMGLTPSLESALAAVAKHGPLTLGRLAEHEGVSPPTITRVVDRLEERHLVERIVDAQDRRVCRVSATDDGRQFLVAMRERRNAWLAARLAALDDDRRERLAAALDVLEDLASGEAS